VNHSQVLKGDQYMNIAAEFEVHADGVSQIEVTYGF
jgi:hypothetical protein